MDLPDSNPKTRYGLAKPGIANIPPVAILALGQAMTNGAAKYGRMNWRSHAVTSSVYYDAAGRHIMAWWDGEQIADDSGVHHLAHAMACLAILIDAEASEMLIDDRPGVPGATADFIMENTVPMHGKAEPEDDSQPDLFDGTAPLRPSDAEYWFARHKEEPKLESRLEIIWSCREDWRDVGTLGLQEAVRVLLNNNPNALAALNNAHRHIGTNMTSAMTQEQRTALLFYIDCIAAGYELDFNGIDAFLDTKGISTPTFPL